MKEKMSLEKEYEQVNRDFYLLEKEVEELYVIGRYEKATYEELVNCVSALLVSANNNKKLLVPVCYTGSPIQQELQVGSYLEEVAVENGTGDGWMVAFTHLDQMDEEDRKSIKEEDVKDLVEKAYNVKNVKGLLINPETQPFILTKPLLELILTVLENDGEEAYGLS